MRKIFLIAIIGILLTVFFSSTVTAQVFDGAIGVSYTLNIKDEGVKDGSIIVSTKDGYKLSRKSYDPSLTGVVTENPAVVFSTEEGNHAVISSGNAVVIVSGENGPIKEGDQITSSSVAGVGMKATRTGYVIGTALEDFNPTNPSDQKKIAVSINIYYFIEKPQNVSSSLLDIFNLSALATYESPSQVLKYVVAAIILIASIVLGFISFGRIARTGIEALGRNPLAARMIQVGIIFNVIITVAIILAGLVLSYLVLRL